MSSWYIRVKNNPEGTVNNENYHSRDPYPRPTEKKDGQQKTMVEVRGRKSLQLNLFGVTAFQHSCDGRHWNGLGKISLHAAFVHLAICCNVQLEHAIDACKWHTRPQHCLSILTDTNLVQQQSCIADLTASWVVKADQPAGRQLSPMSLPADMVLWIPGEPLTWPIPGGTLVVYNYQYDWGWWRCLMKLFQNWYCICHSGLLNCS